jgi:hypothetical protein
MTDYKVSIVVSLDLDPIQDVTIEKIEDCLNGILNDWRDGRYPFYVEQARNGIESCIKSAIYQALEEREKTRYKGQVVTRGNGKTARWIYSTSRAFRKVLWWLDGRVDAKISKTKCLES